MNYKPLKRQKMFRDQAKVPSFMMPPGEPVQVLLEPVRIINMRVTKPWKPWHVKGDRSTPIGNPFWRGEDSRDWCCDMYDEYFITWMQDPNSEVYQHMMKLLKLYWHHGKLELYCWCTPKRCHMETVKRWLENNSNY